jgi:hypothetical protein
MLLTATERAASRPTKPFWTFTGSGPRTSYLRKHRCPSVRSGRWVGRAGLQADPRKVGKDPVAAVAERWERYFCAVSAARESWL